MRFNCKAVSLARDSRGITQDKLSKLIDEPQSVVSAIETGKETPTDEMIGKIATALNYPVRFFEHKTSFTRLSKFYYRKRDAFPTKMITPLEARMDITRNAYSELLKQIDVAYTGLPRMKVTKDNTPEQIADATRMFFNLDDGPIERPIQLVERTGIPVLRFYVESDKFSGMTIQTDNNVPIIILNSFLPDDHQKFTLFHELGHLIMHVPFTEDIEFYEEQLSNRVEVEKQADCFASAFMMPAKKAKASMVGLTYSKLTELKLYWKASKQSIIYRAKDLGVINENRAKYLFIELSRYGERKNESIKISIDKPTLVNDMVNLYINELHYTKKTLANEIAGLNEDDFNEWFGLEDQGFFRIVKNNYNQN